MFRLILIVTILASSIVNAVENRDLVWDVPGWPQNPYNVPLISQYAWYWTDNVSYGIIGDYQIGRNDPLLFRFQGPVLNEFAWLGGTDFDNLQVRSGGLSGGVPTAQYVHMPEPMSALGWGLLYFVSRPTKMRKMHLVRPDLIQVFYPQTNVC